MAEPVVSNNPRKNYSSSIPNDLLNDLSSRFIINVPEEERMDLIRLCFQIELAHWFYLDFYCEENPKLQKVALKDFIRIIFGHIPFLQKYSPTEVDVVIADWREYKKAVPTFGAILLDEEMKNVLLVQSFVYRASWSFPKGKVNKDEQPPNCAIREVLEETGFDISNYIDKCEYLEHYFNDQLIRLYIVTGIPANAKFVPKTRNEIKGCEWFPISQLPTGKKDPNTKSPNSYFMVIPFVKHLKKWIQEKTAENERQFLKQKQLLAQLIKGDFSKCPEIVSQLESRSNRQNKSAYSPPPRMLRQRNLKQPSDPDKKKSAFTNPQSEDKAVGNSKYRKLNTDSPKKDKYESYSKKSSALEEGGMFPISKTWQNFSLDTEALVATFNINLRKNVPRM